MSGYKLNTPLIAGKETAWYKMLRALYRANRPLHKKEWFFEAGIYVSDEKPGIIQHEYGYKTTNWSYRHWKGVYPDLFKDFQWRNLVEYDTKLRKWIMNREEYEKFCKKLNIDP